jgi:hypothetical protein
MDQSDKRVEACIQKLYAFRSNIPANLTINKVRQVWNIDYDEKKITSLIEVEENLLRQKINIAKDSLPWLLWKPIVKFIGISGSVASEFVREEDDIDLFIITKNDTAWIYRLYIYFRNLFKRQIRSKEKVNQGESVKDKLCINFITEQRALAFESDIFNFNELVYLRPIYNENFKNVILLANPWVKEDYLVSDQFLGKDKLKVGDVKNINKRNYLLVPVNFCVFIGQLLFMIIMGHNPNFSRLWEGFKKGKIEFYPEGFKKDKIKEIKSD